MRIADKMAFDQVNGNIAKNRSQMVELQNEAATQKRVTKPSDDPLAAARVLANRSDLIGNAQFTKNLNYAKSFLEFTDQSLGDLSNILMRAKELAISQSNDASANEQSRRATATEIHQLFDQIVNIGNRKLGERFIFGGYQTQQAPFDQKGRYAGDSGEMIIHVDKDNALAMNVPGGQVFLGNGVDANGMTAPRPQQPDTVEQLEKEQSEKERSSVEMRGPASVGPNGVGANSGGEDQSGGVNLFGVMKDLEISLRTNDKKGVQDCLDSLDDALNQVVLTRSQVGARSASVDNLLQTMAKQKIDDKQTISSLEDADIFSTISDINKTQSTLQATLQTSGKLVQHSLLDFLR